MTYSQIKAFFFDLDGTLRIPDPSPAEAFIQIARTLGVEISQSAAQRVKLWGVSILGPR